MEEKNEQEQLVVSDTVWGRVVQIVQEAMLTGVDCADLLREIRLRHCDTRNDTLVMTDAYVEHVKKSHEKLLAQAEELKAKRQAKLIIDPKAS